jgi:hypothetical protein
VVEARVIGWRGRVPESTKPMPKSREKSCHKLGLEEPERITEAASSRCCSEPSARRQRGSVGEVDYEDAPLWANPRSTSRAAMRSVEPTGWVSVVWLKG